MLVGWLMTLQYASLLFVERRGVTVHLASNKLQCTRNKFCLNRGNSVVEVDGVLMICCVECQ